MTESCKDLWERYPAPVGEDADYLATLLDRMEWASYVSDVVYALSRCHTLVPIPSPENPLDYIESSSWWNHHPVTIWATMNLAYLTGIESLEATDAEIEAIAWCSEVIARKETCHV